MQDADRLLRAHRAGLSRLSQRQLSQLRAGSTACLQPDMDPSVCGLCGCWVRRCTCKAKDANGVTPPAGGQVRGGGGLLGSLPTELTLTVALLLPASSPRCSRKQLRLIAYSEDIWSALRLASPWAAQMSAHAAPTPKDSFGNPGSRLAMRQEAMVEARWRAAQWAQAALPLERCRAHERAREAACVTFHDGYLVLTALDPPALQLWRASTLTLAHAPEGDDAILLHADRDARGWRRPPLRAVATRASGAARCGCGTRTGVVLRRLARTAASSAPRSARSPTSSPPPTRAEAACSGTSTTRAACRRRRRTPPPRRPPRRPPRGSAGVAVARAVAPDGDVDARGGGGSVARVVWRRRPPSPHPPTAPRRPPRGQRAGARASGGGGTRACPPHGNLLAAGGRDGAVLLVAELPPALGCEKGCERAAAAAAAQSGAAASSTAAAAPTEVELGQEASRGTPTG